MACDDRGDLRRETVAQSLIGDSIDEPSRCARLAVPGLVALRFEAPAVPRDVVDLERPADRGVGDVGVDQDTVAQANRVLILERHESGPTQRAEHLRLQT